MSITTSSFSTDILAALSAYNYTRDRLPGDKIELPNTYYDIKVKVNDYVISDTVNYSLSKLYDNWLYLISKSIIPSNNIPNKDYSTRMIVDTNKILNGESGYSPSPEWTDTYNTVADFIDDSVAWTSTSGTSIWSGVTHFTKIQNIANPDNYNIIANTSTNLILLSGTETSSINVVGNFFNANNPIWSNSNVTHPSNELTFSNIKNHVITDNNELFVLDSGMNTIFKFDISGILTLDKSILQNDTPGRLMTGMIGGIGQVADKTRFESPVVIETVDNLIYTLDNTSTESVIKVFDSDLNWKRSVSIGTNATSGPVHMKYNDQTDRFYILCHRGTFAKANNNEISYADARLPAELVVLDRDLNYIETKQLNSTQYNTRINVEVYKKIYFSEENKNIMYIVTNKNIFKKYVSRPERFIGRFLLDEKAIGVGDSNQDFNDIIITREDITEGSTTRQKDEILVLDEENTAVYRFLEDSNYERSVQSEFDSKVLDFSDMQVQGDEYVSTLTYNKVLSKHLFNNTLLLENTYRKFTTKFDRNGISQYIGFRYLNSDELSEANYRMPLDCHIGNNELLLTSTINRCFNQILLLQENILDKMQEKSINVFPLITQPVMLLSPFVDFATVTGADTDEDGIFDVVDPDDDDDKLLDVEELALGTDPLEKDTDSDGLTDFQEVYPIDRPATDPDDPDTDDDGATDRQDAFPLDPSEQIDTDDDGTGDNADTDDDNDTFPDGDDSFPKDELKVDGDDSEVQLVDGDGNPSPIPVFDTNGNVLTAANPDGIDDRLDIDDDDDTYLDHDYTSTPNYQDRLDEMIEGVHKFRNPDYIEGVDPPSGEWLTEADPSGDTNPLKSTGKDTDSDGIDDEIDLDDDNDQLSDYEEIHTYGTDPLSADTDEDTLSDYEEVVIGQDGFITDPLSTDTDSDSTHTVGTTAIGISGRDDKDAFPTDPAAFRDTDGDGSPDEILLGSDGLPVESTTGLTEDLDDDDDTISDLDEIAQDTDPKDADTDDDLITDDQDTDPLTAELYLNSNVDPNDIATVTLSENVTEVVYTIDQLNSHLTNVGFLSSVPYTVDTAGFAMDSTGVSATVAQDFESVTNPIIVSISAHGQAGDPIAMKLKVNITNVDEDRDSDTLLDTVDDTDTTPQLQFVDTPSIGTVDSSGEFITITLPTPIEENNAETLIVSLSSLFEPSSFDNTVTYLSASNPITSSNNNDFVVDEYTNLYVAADRDFETSTTITADITAHGQQNNRLDDKRILVTVDISNTDLEDTDSDLIQDDSDLTKSAPQLQFVAPSGTETDITITHASTIPENNPITQLIDIDTLFVNDEWIDGLEITNGANDFTLDGTNLKLSPNRDFESGASLTATVSVSGKEDPAVAKTITYNVTITDVDEDRDSDTLLDSVDDTDLIAQLQFVDILTDVTFDDNAGTAQVTGPTVVENNLETVVIDLANLFENQGWLRSGTPFEITTGATDFNLQGTSLYLNANRDFEQTGAQVTATVTASGQEVPAIVKTITVTATITDEDITVTGKWDDDHTTLWKDIDETWNSLDGS